jgi:manganese oxidase
MTSFFKRPARLLGVLLAGLAVGLPWQSAQAVHDGGAHNIRGITGPTFNLYAYPANIPLPEGTSLYMWLFGDMDMGLNATHPEGEGYFLPQYPGPTLVVNQGETVTINLTNYGIPHAVSIVVTGHEVSSTGGSDGLVGQAAAIGDAEPTTFTFTANQPGTYLYHSLNGPNPGLHVEMGLLGVVIVRPDPVTNIGRNAYGDNTGTDYDHEFLYLLTEVDPDIHAEMEGGHYTHFTNADRFAKIWFVNGRVFPDLFQADFDPAYTHQPYKSLAMTHPTDRTLVRNINGGQDSHPFHYHGENLTFLAQDGRILSSDGVKADLGRSDNTINSAPKQAVDALWVWTGKDLGWDIYGHDTAHVCVDSDGDGFGDELSTYYGEYCPDHGKPFPVTLPGVAEMALGAWYSGSPFLGDVGDLPPGEGGLNPFGGYFFVWHSHAEKELTTFDIFPGGTLSAVVVLPPDVTIY